MVSVLSNKRKKCAMGSGGVQRPWNVEGARLWRARALSQAALPSANSRHGEGRHS